METQPNPNESEVNVNKDFLSRRVDDILKLTNAVKQDVKSLVLTGSLILNFFLVNKLINTNEVFRKEISEEIRKQVPTEVQKQTKDKLEGLVDTIKSTTQDVRNYLEYQRKQHTK